MDELDDKRRYVESRSERGHWGAAELAHIDGMARWLATVDELRADLKSATASYRAAISALGDITKELEESQFSMECCGRHNVEGP